jgi:hypothetical protein
MVNEGTTILYKIAIIFLEGWSVDQFDHAANDSDLSQLVPGHWSFFVICEWNVQQERSAPAAALAYPLVPI